VKAPDYWKSHYVTASDPVEIERAMQVTCFVSAGERLDLVHFATSPQAPNILISQGSGGHAYVFAELAYRMHLAGYNVFVMPKHGGHPVEQLLQRHHDAIGHIAGEFNDTIGVYGEGLGASAAAAS
jgi:alpha-beta hydrolase superfamily lysophospholipase